MMKKMKKKMFYILFLLCSVAIFAETTIGAGITTLVILEPYSEPIAGDDHFAPPTEFSGAAGVIGSFYADFPIGLGDHPLLAGSYISTKAELELSSVHISPRIDVTFAPLPFLYFNAGATIGAAWGFNDDFAGIFTYDKANREYTASSAFSTMYYDAYIQGNFQFDIAAIIPGDWNHIVAMASYKLGYTGLTSGGENGNPWSHIMGGSDMANGLTYSASTTLGYQMPLALNPLVGIQASFSGYFFEDDFDTASYDWDPTFMSVTINAAAILQILDNHSLTLLSGFSSGRSFDKEYADDVPIFEKKTVGREWFFNGLTIIYTYSF